MAAAAAGPGDQSGVSGAPAQLRRIR